MSRPSMLALRDEKIAAKSVPGSMDGDSLERAQALKLLNIVRSNMS